MTINYLIIEHFESTIKNVTVDWNYLSSNPKLKMDFIKKHLDKPWNWLILTLNPAITKENIVDNINLPWDYQYLSLEINKIGWDFVKQNINFDWDWLHLSQYKIPIDILRIVNENNKNRNNKFKYLNWHSLSTKYTDTELSCCLTFPWWYNTRIFRKRTKESLETIFQNVDKLSDQEISEILHINNLSCDYKTYHKIPWSVIIKIKDANWNWYLFSERNDLNIKVIELYPEKDWNWEKISRNKNITWDFVVKNKDFPWNYRSLSENLNITHDILYNDLFYKRDLINFQRNPNFLLSDKDLIQIIKKNHAICVIQRAWRICNSNPEYLICKKRLLKDYYSLIEFN